MSFLTLISGFVAYKVGVFDEKTSLLESLPTDAAVQTPVKDSLFKYHKIIREFTPSFPIFPGSKSGILSDPSAPNHKIYGTIDTSLEAD